MQEVADLIDDSDIEAEPETEIDESDSVVEEHPSFPLPCIILMHSLKKLPLSDRYTIDIVLYLWLYGLFHVNRRGAHFKIN